MTDLVPLAVALSGLIVGSFLNVCIHRLPRGESVVRPPSHCPHCGHAIRPWENVPVLSYLFLRGRCSRCKTRIAWFYPAVEALTAGLFFALFTKYQLGSPFWVGLVFFGLLITLTFIDLFHRILPNVLTLGGTTAGFLLAPLQDRTFFEMPWDPLKSGPIAFSYFSSALGVLLGGGLLWLSAQLYFRVRKIEGMGLGDVKMMAMVGAFLGWRYAWLTILLGSLLGALIGGAYIALFKKGRRYELPFGSFLGVGAALAAFWGPDLLNWYLSRF
jgi:leader peptidase (prepilin peptidase)/N-methyltransferase